MAQRTVLLRLRAEIGGYRSAMAEATRATDTFGDSANKNSVRASSALGQVVESATKHDEAWRTVGTTLLGVGAAVGAGIGLAISKYSEFDAAMSAVQASTGASKTSLVELREAALQAGADTEFSATEAAGAIEELAKAGVSTQDILGGGLSGALSLAAAGGIAVADAAEIAASTLTQFSLAGSDVGHVADLLASGANKAQGGVGDLGQALNQSGLIASQFGLSVEETIGTLSAFASAGLLGSDAGTSFRTMLLRLANPAKETQETMAALGISAYDAEGSFVGVASLAQQLQDRLGGLTQAQRDAALAQIFGSDAIRAANILYSEGAEGIDGWIAAVDDTGAAAETAAARTDNLRGDLERLGGAFDTLLIRMGSGADGPLRFAVQGITSLVDGFAEAPAAVQNTTLVLGAVVGAASLAGGAFLTLAPRILETRAAVNQLATDMPRLTAAGRGLARMGGAAIGIATVTTAVIALSEGLRDDKGGAAGANATAQALDLLAQDRDFSAIDRLFSAEFASDGAFGIGQVGESITSLDEAFRRTFSPTSAEQVDTFLGGIGVAMGSTADTTFQLQETFRSYDEQLATMVAGGNVEGARAAFDGLVESAVAQGASLEEARALFPQYEDALIGASDAAAGTGEASTAAAEGIATTADEAEQAAQAVESFQDALDQLLDQAFGVEAATDSLTGAFAELAENAGGFERTLEGNSEAALANRESVRGLVEGIFDLADAQARGGASSGELVASLEAQRSGLVDALTAMGFSREEVERYAAAIDPATVAAQALATATEEIPAQASTEVLQPGMPEARDAAADLRARYSSVPEGVDTTITQPGMPQALGLSTDLRSRYLSVPEGVDTTIAQPGMPQALGLASDLTGRTRGIPTSWATSIGQPGMSGALSSSSDLTGRVRGIPTQWSTSLVMNGASAATSAAAGVRDAVLSIPTTRTVNVQVRGSNIRATEFSAAGNIFLPDAHPVATFAGGGLWDAITQYGAGGSPGDVPDGHMPELVGAAGPVRVWKEQETRGEAYLPLADDWRRPRARAIAEQVVDIFGGQVQWLAAGGLRPGERTSYVAPPTTAGTRPDAAGARVDVRQTIVAPSPVAAGRMSAARLGDVLVDAGLGGAA